MQTRTGNLPIGFRRLRFSPWQRDLSALITWAKAHDFPFIDLGPDADAEGRQVVDAGLGIGSADLPDWNSLIAADAGRRRAAVEKSAAYMQTCSKMGVNNFFMVMLPDKPEAPRTENFSLMVDSLNALSPTLDQLSAHLVIEGWPGPGALCCTPESVRAMMKACPSPNVGLNYDPSHLLRMGIDPLRFLEEFVPRVYHFHGKDTELLPEAFYEFGTEQPPTWASPHHFGGLTWRYTIPGHGCFRWVRAIEILMAHGYHTRGGRISIELEDEHFNGSEEGERRGLLASASYLASC